MQEEWKDIPEFNGAYQISNYGRLKSIARTVNGPHGTINLKEKYLSQVINKSGYIEYQITYNGKHYGKKAHRLVAQAFIPNPKNKPHINHKDGNKINNMVSNLEWCTPRENVIHAYNHQLKRVKHIMQYSLDGKLIREWINAGEITRELGIGKTTIHAACKRNQNHRVKGFIWKYKEVNNE